MPKGPLFPDSSRPGRGSLDAAVKVARSLSACSVANANYADAIYILDSLASKSSLRSTWFLVSRGLGLEPLPLTPEKIHSVCAVLRAGAYRFAYSYVTEMRQFHIRSGFPWEDSLKLP